MKIKTLSFLWLLVAIAASGQTPVIGASNVTESLTATAGTTTELDFVKCLANSPRQAVLYITGATSTGTLGIQVFTGGAYDTSHYVSAGFYNQILGSNTVTARSPLAAAQMDFTGLANSSPLSVPLSGFFVLTNPSALAVKSWNGVLTQADGTNNYAVYPGDSFTQTTAITGFRVKSSGTFGGVFTCVVTQP